MDFTDGHNSTERQILADFVASRCAAMEMPQSDSPNTSIGARFRAKMPEIARQIRSLPGEKLRSRASVGVASDVK
jgi:hypothetical protein